MSKRASGLVYHVGAFWFIYLFYVCTNVFDFLQGFTLNGRPVLNNFLEVKGTFQTATNATVHTPPVILLHFYLHSIQHVAHFNVVEQLLSEFYLESSSNLQIKNIPFNISDAQTLEKWDVEASSHVAELSTSAHVIVFITTHTDPERGDLWLGHDKHGKPFAAASDDVSTCLFYCTDVDREFNSGSIKF
jgi:hypothetical protein